MAPKKKAKKSKLVEAAKPRQEQPTESPYLTPPVTLVIGESRQKYTIQEYFIRGTTIGGTWNNFGAKILIDVSDVHEDVGHTLAHYLCTGDYQTIRNLAGWDGEQEYRRSVLAYSAATTYGLEGLEEHARRMMLRLDYSIPILTILNLARSIYSKLPEKNTWFKEYIKDKMTAAFCADEGVFREDEFLGIVGTDPGFDKFLMRSVGEIYAHKIMTLRDENEHLESLLTPMDVPVEYPSQENLALEAPVEEVAVKQIEELPAEPEEEMLHLEAPDQVVFEEGPVVQKSCPSEERPGSDPEDAWATPSTKKRGKAAKAIVMQHYEPEPEPPGSPVEVDNWNNWGYARTKIKSDGMHQADAGYIGVES
ncbi:predicted protein [Uncinocarpus reesii 1704]|uniref:BTB domain-containing protein n=1 Tax=Uncinocarpus reesii (strain UAMH 1704) TaxID=336963 RepID=C4JDD5_UNCRE|nr:uncharacterized protein UREG_00301 [Uncinocarpus reesii 1704]EEP75455.1 predicted protein [Uncinocarpus reesii 1704]